MLTGSHHIRERSLAPAMPCKEPGKSSRNSPAIVFFRGPAQRLLTLRPARSPSRLATLYIESSDSLVASAAASIASTGWSEPVPGQECHPLKSSAFHGALLRRQGRAVAPFIKGQPVIKARAQIILRHLEQGHSYFTSLGCVVWPHLLHMYRPSTWATIGRNSRPNTQYGHRTVPSICVLSFVVGRVTAGQNLSEGCRSGVFV